MIGDRVVSEHIEFVVVFDGRQSLAAEGQGSTLGSTYIASSPTPRRRGEKRGRKRERGWHQLTTIQRLRAQRELRGE